MKLYIFPASPNTRTVLATAEHLGLKLDTQVVDLMKGEQNHTDFLALNPNAKVPVLVDENFVLWESVAIAQYLAEKHEDNTLYPKDAAGRADASRWMAWRNAHWQPPIGGLIGEELFKPMRGETPDADRVTTLMGQFRTVAAVLNEYLDGKSFLLGNPLTVADFSVGSMLTYAEACKLPIGNYPAISAWYERLEALPAWQKTAPQFG